MVWSCYEERKFGICKNGYENERRRKKRKRKTEEEVVGCDMRTDGVCVDDVGDRVK